MRLYLMRHAEAVDPNDWRGSDRDRPLTPTGLAKLESATEHMRRLKLSADVLLASPYLRATQTADVIAQELHILQSLRCSELAAGARLSAFLSVMQQQKSASSVWVVAHMPDICTFASRATGLASFLEQSFQPAETIAIDVSMDGDRLGTGPLLWKRRLDDWPTASA